MLGVISEINDMLQDVQGKKSVDMKRRIIRSLGALVELIGHPIHNVSPQVGFSCTLLIIYLVLFRSWQHFKR